MTHSWLRRLMASLISLVTFLVGTLSQSPAASVPQEPNGIELSSNSCPQIWTWRPVGSGDTLSLVLRAKSAITADVDLNVYLGTHSYRLSLPSIAVATVGETSTVPYRSTPIVFRNPEPTVEPKLVVSFTGEYARCPHESRELSLKTNTSPGRNPTQAFRDLKESIDNEIATAPVHELSLDAAEPAPTCAQMHKDASSDHPRSPVYPEIARQQGITGNSVVIVSLDANGKTQGAEIYSSSGSNELDRAALDAANESSYTPEISACVSTAGTYLFHVEFSAR